MSVRIWVELRDPRHLQKFMANKGLSVRDLTDLVNRDLRRRRAKNRRTVSKSTIGNLRSGAAKTTDPEVALAIAEVLDAPRDILFCDRVSNYSTGTKHERAA
ncbi:MAG: helix-turn-helix domain-containing protein [Marmoricola sp.]